MQVSLLMYCSCRMELRWHMENCKYKEVDFIWCANIIKEMRRDGLFHQKVMCFVQNATGSTKKGI